MKLIKSLLTSSSKNELVSNDSTEVKAVEASANASSTSTSLTTLNDTPTALAIIPPCNEPGCSCVVKHYHGIKRVDGKSNGNEAKAATQVGSNPTSGVNGGNRAGFYQTQQSSNNSKTRLRIPHKNSLDPLEFVDMKAMHILCTIGIDDFDKLGQRTNTQDGSYIFIDRGASILAVAHRDTVCPANDKFRYVVSEKRVYTPTLDDRLGCTILLDILDKMLPKNSYDILLTEGEETGRSTAKYFEPPEGKEYKWMFQFDRGGTDIVHYQYTDPEWMGKLEDTGIKVELGAFSDICYLEHLGICGVNWGTAYYSYHSANAYCNLDETVDMVKKFAEFFKLHQATTFKHDREKYDKHGEKRKYENLGYSSGYGSDIGQKQGHGAISFFGDGWDLEDEFSYLEDLIGTTPSLTQTVVDIAEEAGLVYPIGHLVTCVCTGCVEYWVKINFLKQKRYELWNEAERKRARNRAKTQIANSNRSLKSNHTYHALCICYNCKEHRGEICKHSNKKVCDSCRKEVDTQKLDVGKRGSRRGKKTKQKGKGKAKSLSNFRSWNCLNCGEENHESLSACLNCQTERSAKPYDDLVSDSTRLIPALRLPLTRSPLERNNKRDLPPMSCHWCGAKNCKRLRSVSGGDLLCDGCFLYAKDGDSRREEASDDNMPLHLM